jgi:O-antigen/teichoic acid export membrane protein
MALNLATFGLTLEALGAGGFGQVSLALAAAYVITTLAGFGLDQTIFRRLSLSPDDGVMLGTGFVLRIMTTWSAAFASMSVVAVLPLSPDTRWPIWAALSAVALGPATLLQQVLRSRVELVPLAVADVAGSVMSLLGILVLRATGLVSPVGVVLCTVVPNAVVWLSLAALAVRRVRPRFRGWSHHARSLLREARPIAFGDAAVVGYYRADVLIVAAVAGTTAVGIYSAVYRLVDVAMYVQSTVIGAAFPMIARAWADGADKVRPLLTILLGRLVELGAIAFLLAVAVGPPLLRALGGADFDEVDRVVVLLMAALVVMFVNRLTVQALVAGGFGRQQLVSWAGGVAGAAACVVLARTDGAAGAAAATLVGEILVLFISCAFLLRRGALGRDSIGPSLPAMLLVAALLIAGWMFRPDPAFLLPVALVGCLFMAILLFTGHRAPTDDDAALLVDRPVDLPPGLVNR